MVLIKSKKLIVLKLKYGSNKIKHKNNWYRRAIHRVTFLKCVHLLLKLKVSARFTRVQRTHALWADLAMHKRST
jgi:hypothetical protein